MEKKIDLQLLKKLRNTTFVSYALCKEALITNNNNFDKALEWLRIKGIAKAQTKSDRKTSEGICGVFYKGNYAILFQLKCETDFVGKNKMFQNFFWDLGNMIAENQITNKKEILLFQWNAQTVKENILELSGKMGEKIHLDEVKIANKGDKDIFFKYSHNDKICSLVVLSKEGTLNVGEEIAMHIVAMKPKFLDLKKVEETFIIKEKEIILNQTKEEMEKGKIKAHFQERIIESKLEKAIKEQCLLEQKFIKNPKQSIKEYLKEKDVKILDMYLLGLGD